nr:Flp pilus assembly complex ATPase component TadA [Deltaproteobacteria bacterium]
LRLLPDQAPLDRLGLDIGDWLERSGVIVIAGPSGAGKTVTLAALVGALGARKRVITLEDPIEILQSNPAISQREVGAHVASISAGIAGALRENPGAIAIGSVTSPESAAAVIDAACSGCLVVTTIASPSGNLAIERLIDWAGDRRELARAVLGATLLGTILPTPSRGGRTFEVNRPGERQA